MTDKCLEKYESVYCIKCSMCSKKLVEEFPIPIKSNIPGGIRGCGTPRSIYFCNKICEKEYQDTKMCQVCKCSYDFIIIDGKTVCSDDSSYMDHPTCKQKYTGEYICNFCDKTKNISNENCYMIHNYDYDDTIYMCSECFKPYESVNNDYKYMFINKKWRHIYYNLHTNLYDMIVNKNKHNKFICNKCNVVKLTENNINIFDNMNLCNECL
jgi:hypothetical protein